MLMLIEVLQALIWYCQ